MLGAYENWVETAPKQATCVTLFLYFWIEHVIFYMRNIWCKLLHRGGFNKGIIVKNNSMYILIWLVLEKPNCYKNSNNWSYIIGIFNLSGFSWRSLGQQEYRHVFRVIESPKSDLWRNLVFVSCIYVFNKQSIYLILKNAVHTLIKPFFLGCKPV